MERRFSISHSNFISMKTNPPHWAEKFFRWFCKPELFETLDGDLQESFEDRLNESSLGKARWYYIREVLGMLRPGIIRPLFPNKFFFINTSMIKNYLKVAFRQIGRHKLFSGLNIIGLASSMAVCLLIIMIVVDHFGYDNFHENKGRIYRLVSDKQGGKQYLRPRSATAPMTLATELKEQYPWVDQTVRISKTRADIKYGDEVLPLTGFWTEQSFLEVFSFGWGSGNRQTSLQHPNTIVITEKTRHLLFKDKPALGENVSLHNGEEFVITGIIPNPPRQSHLQFDFLLSLPTIARLKAEGEAPFDPDDWTNAYGGYVYLTLEHAKYENDLALALESLAEKSSQMDKLDYLFAYQHFTKIAPLANSDISNPIGLEIPRFLFYILLGLGSIILVLACFNYTNLSIVKAIKRADEIGIRKVVGASRGQIIVQFIMEAILISLMALFLSIFLLEFLIEGFYSLNPFIEKFFYLSRTYWMYLIFLGFSIITGMVAGLLPAVHLSRLRVVQALKKLKNLRTFSYTGLRKTLLVLQFGFSIIFILTTLIILRQQDKLVSTELGFKSENIINVDLQGVDYNIFAQKLKQLNQVIEVSGSVVNPSTGINIGMAVRPVQQELFLSIDHNVVCGNYLENLEIELVAGQSFPELAIQDQERYVIINQQAVPYLGFDSPASSIGEKLFFKNGIMDSSAYPIPLTIIGVVKDFHYLSLGFAKSKLGPYAIRHNPEHVDFANIKISGENVPGALSDIQEAWTELDNIHALRFDFFDEKIANTYVMFTASSRILGLIGVLAIIIACLGLLGMVTYTVESRIREIGIRKVLGASQRGLIWKLSKEFLWLLGIAIVLAVPISIFVNQLWLENFTIRIDIGPGILLAGIGILLSLSLLAVVSQTWRAAKMNPADTLKAVD